MYNEREEGRKGNRSYLGTQLSLCSSSSGFLSHVHNTHCSWLFFFFFFFGSVAVEKNKLLLCANLAKL